MKMRLWNLSSFETLGTPVLTAQPAFASVRKTGERRKYASSPIKIAMQVAALTAACYSVAVCGSSTVLTVPKVADVDVVCNVDVDRSPLEALFAGRFTDNWTREKEDQLLGEAVKKPPAADRDFRNLAHTAQHETVSENAPRLSEEDILKLSRRKV
jgi:hypothetical protein